MSLRDFGTTATKLTHNPLGIIALFIVLVYAFASLVVGFGANLEQAQKTPLIWFLVLFPVLVLLVFAWLVSRHHMKLYAPADYRDEKLFVYPISPEEQRLRLQDEADAIQSVEPSAGGPEHPQDDKTRPVSSAAAASERNSVVSKYLMAEDLALRQLEGELGLPIERQVEILFSGGRIMLDGLVRRGDQFTGIEVKYVRIPHPPISLIQAALYRFVSLGSVGATGAKEGSFRFIFVFVAEFAGEELDRFEARTKERFPTTPVTVGWRFYNFDELRKKFGIIEEKA
jgi:hypothetical protein